MLTIKKYSNRRLYDTDESRYITLDELAGRVRQGNDVRVVDAKSGADLTQVTLTQIIVESRGLARLLPAPLLMQLIRLGDDMLAEFFSRYVTWALQTYLHVKRFAPFGGLGPNPFAGGFGGGMPGSSYRWGAPPPPPYDPGPQSAPPPEPEPAPPVAAPAAADDIAELRKQLEELKALLGGPEK